MLRPMVLGLRIFCTSEKRQKLIFQVILVEQERIEPNSNLTCDEGRGRKRERLFTL